MKRFASLAIVFALGCFATFVLNGEADKGYERLWFISIFISGFMTTIPAIVYALIYGILEAIWPDKPPWQIGNALVL